MATVEWALEYSEYAEKEGLYPWHIDHLERVLAANVQDFLYGDRGQNKGLIVFIGTFEACQVRCDELIRAKKSRPEEEAR